MKREVGFMICLNGGMLQYYVSIGDTMDLV